MSKENRERCEREVFYESLGMEPVNCIENDRTLCPVCLRVFDRIDEALEKHSGNCVCADCHHGPNDKFAEND